ncbi:CIR protein [Plasmodium chabaudi chabaudi]|uniref:CIR protein n=1 Tax=Plasmodium chabaudi chabaudi TaxID=31271 RepID=A0A1D3L9K6_PLACU|nr:CIR protein [Plasmodium chabaudi chabaudi]
MSYNQACKLFSELDELFNSNSVDEDSFNGLSVLYNDYCPERGESKRCDTDYDRISAVAGYLFMYFITENGIDINNNNDYYIQYFVMWISNKLYEIATNNSKYLNQSYEINLDKSIGNFDFLNSRDDTKELKDANITIMNILYLLFKEICKAVWMDQGKSTEMYKHTTQITQCFLIYTALSKFVNPCSPYLELLDHLKTLYDDYRDAAIQNKIHGKYTPELLRRFPEIDKTTQKFNFTSPECKKVHEQLIKNAQKLIKEEKEKEEGNGKAEKKEKINGYEEEEEDEGDDEGDDEGQDDDALSSLLKLLTSGDDNNKEPGNGKSQDKKLEKRDESKDSRSKPQGPGKSSKSITVTQAQSSKDAPHSTNVQSGTNLTPAKPATTKPEAKNPKGKNPKATKPAAPSKSQLKPETQQKTQQQTLAQPTTGRPSSTTSSIITTSPTDTQTSNTTASSGTKSESLKLSRSEEPSNPQKETKIPPKAPKTSTTQPEAQPKIAAKVTSPQTESVKTVPAQTAAKKTNVKKPEAVKPVPAKPPAASSTTTKQSLAQPQRQPPSRPNTSETGKLARSEASPQPSSAKPPATPQPLEKSPKTLLPKAPGTSTTAPTGEKVPTITKTSKSTTLPTPTSSPNITTLSMPITTSKITVPSKTLSSTATSTGETTSITSSLIKSAITGKNGASKESSRVKRSLESGGLINSSETGSGNTGGQSSSQHIIQEDPGDSSKKDKGAQMNHVNSSSLKPQPQNQTLGSNNRGNQPKNEYDRSPDTQNKVGNGQGNADTRSETGPSSDTSNRSQSPNPKQGGTGSELESSGKKSTNNTSNKIGNLDNPTPRPKAQSQAMGSGDQGNGGVTSPSVQNSGNGIPNGIDNGTRGTKDNVGTGKSGEGNSNSATVNNEEEKNKKIVRSQGIDNKQGSSSSGSVDTNGGTGVSGSITGGKDANKGSSGGGSGVSSNGSNSLGSGINTDKQPQKVLPSPSPQASSSSLHLSPPPVTSSPSATPLITLSSSVPGTIPIEPITTNASSGENAKSDMSSIERTLPGQIGGSKKLYRARRSANPGSLVGTSTTGSESAQETQSNTTVTDVKMNEKPSIWCIGSNKKCNIIGIGIIGISIFVFLAFLYKYLSFGSRKKSKKKKITKKVINLVDGRKMEKTFIKSIDREKKPNIIINSGDNKKIAKIIINSDDTNKATKTAINPWDEKRMTHITINSDDTNKATKTAIDPWDEKRKTHITINSDDNIKPIKTEINPRDGKRKTHITINSEHTKKYTKSVIKSDTIKKTKIIVNSVNGKMPLLNIYKLLKADPIPFINLFFLLIFFVYKRKQDTTD